MLDEGTYSEKVKNFFKRWQRCVMDVATSNGGFLEHVALLLSSSQFQDQDTFKKKTMLVKARHLSNMENWLIQFNEFGQMKILVLLESTVFGLGRLTRSN